jgi:thymidylate kinase
MRDRDMRNLFLIVEGPDNVGKSTLINNLNNYYNKLTMHNLHYSNVKQENTIEVIKHNKKLYDEMFRLMIYALKQDYTGVICDRSHLGEIVYGNIYRGYAGDYVLDIEKDYHHILDIFENLFLITLVDEPENLISREDGLSLSTDLDKKQRELELFDLAHNSSNIKHKLIINIKDKDAEAVFKEVTEFIDSKYNS